MNVCAAVLLPTLFAFQTANPPVKKPYSSHKQPIHAYDVYMASPAAKAAAAELRGDCGDATDQATMNACFSAEYAKADASLHRLYELDLKQLEGSDRVGLIKTQNAGLRYREAECQLEADLEIGGSIMPTVYYSCLKEKTIARQSEMQSDYRRVITN
jgi:uncharacterized protein YecT (DUF1311 family)